MESVDIFKEGSSLQETWAKWENIGDSVQGTYVGFVLTADPKGNPQNAYHLRQPDGSIVSVGVKLTKKKFIALMDQVQPGQIIGIKFTKTLPAITKGYSDTKILEIFTKPGVFDEKWLKDQAILKSMRDSTGEAALEAEDEEPETEGQMKPTAESEEPFPSRTLTDEEKISKIGEYANAKLNVSDPLLVREKVMEATGLAFIVSNLDLILEKLRSM